MDDGYEQHHTRSYESASDCHGFIKDDSLAQSCDKKSRKSSLESCISRGEQCYQVGLFWIKTAESSVIYFHCCIFGWQVSSTTNNNNNNSVIQLNTGETLISKSSLNYFSNAKYKNQIMEKYLRGLDGEEKTGEKCGLELSKWLESAANFTPDKNNYIEWESRRSVTLTHFHITKKKKKINNQTSHFQYFPSHRISSKHDDYPEHMMDSNILNLHQKEELDAAEALTFLAGNCKNRLVK